jgi:hypothetical protein
MNFRELLLSLNTETIFPEGIIILNVIVCVPIQLLFVTLSNHKNANRSQIN